MIAKNPVLEGFYPDPSICVVEDTFYLVNSTFAYFPGVPIFQSKNLRDWEQIGNVLNRSAQLPLGDCYQYAGIYAPTIRYFNGIFYMVTTNVGNGGNFYVTAKDPKGPWSDPNYLGEEAKGIDPSLFFDEDGRCYYTGSRGCEPQRYAGEGEIWIQELDLNTKKLIGEQKVIYKGSQEKSLWAEGPHIYKKDGYYYVMIAEGGTEYKHSISIARSKSILGPYENNPCNPIFSHRQFGMDYPIMYVGHGDLFEGPDKNWYMICLASRPIKGETMLGRETFLAKVDWIDGWPIVNPGIGRLENTIELPFEEDVKNQRTKGRIWHFYDNELPIEALLLRNPKENLYSLTEREGFLRLHLQEETLEESKNSAFVGFRQIYHDFEVTTRMSFASQKENESAGLAWFQNDKAQIRLEVCGGKETKRIKLITVNKEEKSCVVQIKVPVNNSIELKIKSSQMRTDFSFKRNEKWEMLYEGLPVGFLSTEKAGGFCGCTIGMFGSSNGEKSNEFVDFSYFSMLKM